MWHMYVVRCDDGTLYTGVTTDITRRVNEHNASPRGAKYTKSRRPVTLVYSKAYSNKSLAMKAEYRFKQLTRAEKIKDIS